MEALIIGISKSTHHLISAFLFVILFVHTAGAAAPANEGIEKLDRKNHINNYSITVSDNGDITTMEKNREISVNHIFEAGSLSKPVAAYICMELAREGKLSLDAPIAQYLSEEWKLTDERYSDITVRNLLSHTSGFSPSFEFGIDKKYILNQAAAFLIQESDIFFYSRLLKISLVNHWKVLPNIMCLNH